MQSLPHPALLLESEPGLCFVCTGLGPRETEATCPLEAPSVSQPDPQPFLAGSVLRAEGLHYLLAPCWVPRLPLGLAGGSVLVREGGGGREGVRVWQAGTASSLPPPRHRPLPGLPSQQCAAAEAGSASWGPSLSLQPPGCQQLPARVMHISQLPGWLLRFPSSEQPVPHIEFSVLNTQRSFCFSWLDLVIHPGSHLKGKGSGVRGLDKGSGSPTASCWTLDKSLLLCLGRTQAQRDPCLPTPSASSGPALGFLPVRVERMHGWPQGFSLAEGFEAPSIKWRVEFPVPEAGFHSVTCSWPIGY